MRIKNIILLLFVFLSVIAVKTNAQNINGKNFSSVRVDDLTDSQIRQFMQQVQASGLSDAELEQVAAAKGMSTVEITKLRDRVEKLGKATKSDQKNKIQPKDKNTKTGRKVANEDEFANPDQTDSLAKNDKIQSQADIALTTLKSKIFGRDLFVNSKAGFEPNLRLATPANYIIGADDEILLDIYGYSEANYQLKVSPEGTINIPYIGVINISGLTVEAATARIKSKLTPVYKGLAAGNTKLSVNIGNIRSIKVIVTGEVTKPGTYSLPSLATVFNALYSSGGPSENGSFRNIEIIRSGKKIAVLDVYDFLLKGELKNNVRLQDQDIVRIPTYLNRVEMLGEVKRPAIFEMKLGEDFNALLTFAGGFTERAYKARIKVLNNTATERKITDITTSQFNIYKPASGDKFYVNEILDRFENRVTISGAIFRPGQYQLNPGLTLSTLIQKAEGLKEDAFLNRAYITRLTPNLNTQLIAVNLQDVLKGTADDVVLKREDEITISSIFDLKEEYKVSIDGQVREPGDFTFAENMSLEELIIKAGGFKESATAKRIEVARRVKNSDASSTSAITSEVFQIDINTDLSTSTSNFILQPFDIVMVRLSPGYEVQKQVRIEGEVMYPGTYSITRKDERISDLVKRAGGLTALAYTNGASLKRPSALENQLDVEKEQQKLLQFKNVQKNTKQNLDAKDTKDSTALNIESKVLRNDFVGINLTKILAKPGKRQDLFLEKGDILNIPKQLQTVKVSGQVLSPNTVVYIPSKGFKQYVSSSGGFSQGALKSRSYIIYANGSVKSTKKFLFFNNYPEVETGAEIFVPKREEKNKLSAGEVVGITTGVASLGAIILGVLNLMK
ncbi:MAG: capsule biosynthesis protein [Sphingobacteriales bacterium]|nr:MAG: capsule biosynthesis protein [Sphingobacteriales bacterium]